MEFSLLSESYDRLKNLGTILLTKREIDIIACILHGRTSRKSIAAFLSTDGKSVSHRTIEYHTQNIIHKFEGASWEDIREVVENSPTADLFKRHYEIIRFEQLLIKVLFKLQEETDLSISVNLCADSDKSADTKRALEDLIQYFYSYKININLKILSKDVNVNSILNNNEKNQYIIYDETNYSLDRKKNQNLYCINYGSSQNVYSFLVFLLSRLSIESEMINKLQQQLGRIFVDGLSSEDKSRSVATKSKNYLFWLISGVCSLLIMLIIMWEVFQREGAHIISGTIRSDMTIPAQTNLLDRPQITRKVQNRLFSKENDSQTNPVVTLLGIGGAGKTTLARSIARRTKLPVVWEILAETDSSLLSSLTDLAQKLAITPLEKEALSTIQETQDLESKRKKTLQFLQNALRQKKGWLLVFDNVESIQKIANYLPLDKSVWGKGHIIITTQNAYAKKVEFLNHEDVIEVTQLGLEEATKLFTSICFNTEPKKLSSKELEELEKFLPQIPLFPLDISIAAKYISINKTSFEDYIKNIQQQDRSFYSSQENILKETSRYIKSRFSVITLTLNNLIKLVPESEKLLWLISLVDSQNIPLDLLIMKTNSKTTNLLLHTMRKFSLIASEHEKKGSYSFSIHRSTQAVLRSYLIERLNLSAQHELVVSSADLFGKYIRQILDKESISKILDVLPHCEHWLVADLDGNETKGMILSNLGSLKYHIGSNREARIDLEHSLALISELNKHAIYSAQAQTYLGSLCAKSGEVKKAQEYLDLALIKLKEFPSDIGYPRAMSFLGYTFMVQDNFNAAMKCFDLTLEYFQDKEPHPILARTLIYEGLLAKEHMQFDKAILSFKKAIKFFEEAEDLINTGWVKGYLGITYREMGLYEKSRVELEGSVVCYRKANASKHNALGVVLLGLGNCYRNLGLYQKAKQCFDECERIYIANGSEINLAWCKAHQGRLNLKLKNVDDAQHQLLGSQKIFENVYGKNNIRTAWLYLQLGRLYRQQQQLKTAETYLNHALEIYTEKLPDNYLRISKIKVEIGVIEYLKGNHSVARNLLEENIPLYKKYYGESHTQTATALVSLSRIYKALGETQLANQTYKAAIKIFSINNHVDRHIRM